MAYHSHSQGRGRWNDGRRNDGRRYGTEQRGRWNFNRRNRWNQDGHSDHQAPVDKRYTEQPKDDVRQLLEMVTRSLDVFSKRIDKIEQGPDRNSDRPRSGQHTEAGPTTLIKSNNDDFASVVRDLYRMVQLQHHQDNWTQLPKSLEERLNKFANDIHPPMGDDELHNKIMEATCDYSSRICETVRQHIQKKLSDTETVAATRDSTDLNRAMDIADKHLSRRLGRRLPEDKRHKLLEGASEIVGSDRQQPRIDSDGFQRVVNRKAKKQISSPAGTPSKKRKLVSTPSPTNTSNRYTALQNHADVEDDDVIVEFRNGNASQNKDVSFDITEQDKGDNDDALLTDKRKSSATALMNAVKNGLHSHRDNVAVSKVSTPTVVVAAEVHATADAGADITATVPPAAAGVSVVSGDKPTTRSSSRMRSFSAERPRMRPSAATMKTQYGVTVHDREKKEQWQITLRADTDTLLIGDSNVRDARNFPTSWQVHSLPGARFAHVNAVLRKLTPTQQLRHVIIQVGINHRAHPASVYTPEVEEMLNLLTGLEVYGFFVGVSTATSLLQCERDNIDALNEMMESAFTELFVKPLPSDQVGIKRHDSYGIHYDISTVDKVIRSISEHVHTNLN